MTQFLDEIEGHIPALRRYARALTGNVDRADDLVQDCLERAIRKRRLWKPTGALKSWLFRILLNIYRNDLKRNSHAPTQAIDTLVSEPAMPAPQTDRLALSEMSRAIEELPPDQREALLLVALEGMRYSEAAKVLDIPTGTLMSRLSRARANLKERTSENAPVRLRTVK